MATPTQIRKRGRLSLILGTIIAAVAFTAVAYADNVHNDVVAGGNDTITAGGSTTVRYFIQDVPTGNCDAADGSAVTLTINVPAGVTVDSDAVTPGNQNTLTFSSCGPANNKGASFSSSVVGNHTITVSATDASGSYNTNPGTWTLKVNAASDSTAPVITLSTDDAKNATSGWFNSASDSGSDGINLTASASDSSGIKSLSCDDSYKANAAATPAVSSLIDESYSSPFSSPQSESAALSDGIHSISCSATDGVDNAGAATGSTSMPAEYKVDLTDPSVSLVGGPADGASYYFGFVPAAPTCNASDATSGLAGACSVSGYGTLVGSHTVKANASDNAGNSAEASNSYSVLAWTLNGFYHPVDMGGIWNTVKGGSTVPLKFEVFAGSTELTDPAIVNQPLKASQQPCVGGSEDQVELTATGSTALRYDATAGQFIYNWQTPKKPGFCYVVTVTMADGSTLVANFKLK